jgi:hypothetical protein
MTKIKDVGERRKEILGLQMEVLMATVIRLSLLLRHNAHTQTVTGVSALSGSLGAEYQ